MAVGGAIVIFGAFMLIKGANPIDRLPSMWESTFQSTDSLEQILVKATPIILAALAVTVPARAGLVNVGGEGQLIIGGVGRRGGGPVARHRSADRDRAAVDGDRRHGRRRAVGGHRRRAAPRASSINEAVTTLLLNYVAVDVLVFLIYDRVEGPAGLGPAGHGTRSRRRRSCR